MSTTMKDTTRLTENLAAQFIHLDACPLCQEAIFDTNGHALQPLLPELLARDLDPQDIHILVFGAHIKSGGDAWLK